MEGKKRCTKDSNHDRSLATRMRERWGCARPRVKLDDPDISVRMCVDALMRQILDIDFDGCVFLGIICCVHNVKTSQWGA